MIQLMVSLLLNMQRQIFHAHSKARTCATIMCKYYTEIKEIWDKQGNKLLLTLGGEM